MVDNFDKAMLQTFQQVQNSRVADVAGVDPAGSDFISMVNEATDRLMRRGNWFGTVQPMIGCSYDNCVVWPRRVTAVLALNTRCRYNQPANRWYQFMDWNQSEHYGGLYLNWRGRGRAFVANFDGNLPVFNPIPCGIPMSVRFYVDSQTDVGKNIVIYGRDNNNQALWGQRSDGTIQNGLQLTLQMPYVQSPVPLTAIDRVYKDVTDARVRGYRVDSNGFLYDMALYEPSEQSPDYIRSRVGHNAGTITALVKLAFVPVQFPDDLVLIENIEALSDMVFSIRKKESGNLADAMALEKTAIRSLNYEMRQRYPDEQFIVRFEPFGRGNDLNNWYTRAAMI
jgi:hypothetical protein